RPRQLADRRPRAQRAGDPARRADDAHHAVHVHPAVEDDGERRALRPGAAWLSCGRRRARPALVVRRARALIPCARIWVRPTVKHPAARRAKPAGSARYFFSAAAPPSRVKLSRGAASAVNSVGRTIFVAGLAPSARSASRYCSVIVFASTVCAYL